VGRPRNKAPVAGYDNVSADRKALWRSSFGLKNGGACGNTGPGTGYIGAPQLPHGTRQTVADYFTKIRELNCHVHLPDAKPRIVKGFGPDQFGEKSAFSALDAIEGSSRVTGMWATPSGWV